MLLLALSACAVAQPAPPPAPAPETPKKDAAPDKPAEKPKSLDDLLGIPKQSQTSDRPGDLPAPANDPAQAQRELERALKGESVGEMFEEAVILMRDAASRVDQRGDVGAATQRMQEEIIARLDAVIAKAQQQQQQSSSSSSSSSSQSQDQQQQPGQRGQQQQQQQGQGEPSDSTGAGSAQDSAQTRGWLDSAAPTWGKLPDRLRDALLQGAGDSFSSLYERMTEEYYRRLAEERPNP
jgi:hypothetical protein